jgi:hypothetical protein
MINMTSSSSSSSDFYHFFSSLALLIISTALLFGIYIISQTYVIPLYSHYKARQEGYERV